MVFLCLLERANQPCSLIVRWSWLLSRRRQRFRNLLLTLWKACQRWASTDCVDLSAAFAYHTLQSIFPLLLIALAVAARVVGTRQSVDDVLAGIAPLLPPSVLDLVTSTLKGLVDQGFGAGVLGVVVLLLTASNAYLTLQRGSDRLWQDVIPSPVAPPPLSIQAWRFLQNRLEAFLSVLVVSLLIGVGQLLSSLGRLPEELLLAGQNLFPNLVGFLLRTPIFSASRFLFPALWLSLLALLLQRVLASRRIPLMPLIPGSVLIGLALTFLNEVLSLSIISLGSRYQAYGVIGGVLLLSLWVWLIGVIVYFGQCWSVELASSRLQLSSVGDPNQASA